jgi:transcriptional regulator with XRE-family HTH domain
MIRQHRKQADLAEQIGTNDREIRRIISGQVPSSEKELKDLCKALGISKARIESVIATGDRYELRAVDRSFVERSGWSGLDLLTRLRALDHAIVGTLAEKSLEENEWEAPLEELVPVYMHHPDTWRVVINGDENIVGYWHFNVLTPDKYARARTGKLLDQELTSEALLPLNFPGIYDIYISFMGILPSYNNALVGGFYRLLFSLIDVLDQLSNDEVGIYVHSVCANSLTSEARKLCEAVPMPLVAKHEVEGCVFEDTMINILMNLRGRIPISRRRQFEAVLERYMATKRA